MVKYESWREMRREMDRITRRDKVRFATRYSSDEIGGQIKIFTVTTKDGVTYEYTVKNKIVDHPWFDEKIPDGYLFERTEVTLNKENPKINMEGEETQ